MQFTVHYNGRDFFITGLSGICQLTGIEMEIYRDRQVEIYIARPVDRDRWIRQKVELAEHHVLQTGKR